MKNDYRSALSKAKNLGAAHEGYKDWWYQRFTAVILLIFTTWGFYFCWEITHSHENNLKAILQTPHHLMMLVLFVSTGFYHSTLGMKVIIEDYIHCRFLKITLILIIQIFSIVTVCAFIFSVVYILTL